MENGYSKSIYRPSWSAGLAGEIGSGYWAMQPAVPYEQGSFKLQTLYNNGLNTYDSQDDVRLWYLAILPARSLPVTSHRPGVQVFAGTYLGLLLGGRYGQPAITPTAVFMPKLWLSLVLGIEKLLISNWLQKATTCV